MKYQKSFEYKFLNNKDTENFFINHTNQKAYDISNLADFDQNIFLYGPKKSGKSHLLNLWKKKNNSINYDNNFSDITNTNKNIIIDDALNKVSEEELFHVINHCKSYNKKIYITSSIDLKSFDFIFADLYSRLREFYYLEIFIPDEEMCKMYMTKLISERQIIIKNKEIFEFIFNRIERSYESIYTFVNKIDKLSLDKKRQLTIPLIKEII